MGAQIVIGAQWGDEGKGKIVDRLGETAEYVVRYQGGANAGHTVYIDGTKHVLHLLPSGILRHDVKCVIGNGLVFDPAAFFEELEVLTGHNISPADRLYISDRAHLIFPYHKSLDGAMEDASGDKKIGTTLRGIGPAYVDKFNRTGIRVGDLLDESVLSGKLRSNIETVNRILVETYHKKPHSFDEIYEQTINYAQRLKPYICDTSLILHKAWKSGSAILLEGAQGCLLDVDFGTYPFVTSSSPTSGGALTGSGLPPFAIEEITGVMKAYCTRVGEGPFPSEDLTEAGEQLREEGHEFGATTGRPRRCGWFDAVAARFAARINGLTSLALTKMDVLDSLDEIKLCTAYSLDGKIIDEFSSSPAVLERCKPVWESFSGWKSATTECKTFEDLPTNAQNYVRKIEELSGVPVKYISVGVDRDQTIMR